MRRFLVPVDGSDSSLRALAWAIDLAQHMSGVAIHLVNVDRPEKSAAILSHAEQALRAAQLSYTKEALSGPVDRKSTRLNSSHTVISYAVFCLKKKNTYTMI